MNKEFVYTKPKSQVEQFFDRIGAGLYDFSDKYNFEIAKYWHDFPSWSFSFKNPKGGIACVEVMLEENELIKIYGYWWVDSYPDGIRYGKRYETGFLRTGEMRSFLDKVFELILSWELDTWDTVTDGLTVHWHPHYTAEQFERLHDRYLSLNSHLS